jgi:hypothetical protein
MRPIFIDRRHTQEYLELTNRHVVECEKRIERQRRLAAKLQRGGRDAGQALTLLCELQKSLALHIQRRDRMLCELGMGH